jgi:hypothetical protein
VARKPSPPRGGGPRAHQPPGVDPSSQWIGKRLDTSQRFGL